MPYFPDRLANVPGLPGRFQLTDRGAARDVHERLWRREIQEPPAFVDLSEATHDQGTEELASIGLPRPALVWLSYAAEPNTVLVMKWAAFVDHWDDFWYPSSDDVRVATAGDPDWIVEINHEEELRVIRRPVSA